VPTTTGGRARIDARQKKTAEIIQQEVSREVEHLLRLLFCQHGKSAGLELEAVEMAIRSAMHQAGAAALSQRLQLILRVQRSGNDRALAAIAPGI